jgi:hypothetical protein
MPSASFKHSEPRCGLPERTLRLATWTVDRIVARRIRNENNGSAAALVLASRWRGDPDWAVLSRPVRVLALVSAAALVVFASGMAGPYNGVVQRIAVTLPLTAEFLLAGRMLTLPLSGSAAGPGVTPSPGAPADRRLR